ncbi:MAG: chemotaxis protein CheW [Defluviitaleaceae bacterium]|nr:chemotaxis protein CheW [Defluviitaleaceae bacterium]
MALSSYDRLNETAEDTLANQFLTFTIDGEDYGLEVAYVKEIKQMIPITKVPQMPDYIEGILNLRGELIGVINMRTRFGKPFREYDEESCIIVIVFGDFTLGVIVDAIQETVFISEANIAPPPNAKLNNSNHFVRNIGMVNDEVKLLLDLEKFLAIED